MFFYLNLKFSQVGKCCTIIEKLFDFNRETNFNDSIEIKKEKKEIHTINTHNRINNAISIVNLKISERNTDNKKLKFSALDYFQIICNRRYKQTSNCKIYKKGEIAIKPYFDILCIIRFINEFQFFKNKILGKEQLHQINMYKPSIFQEPPNIHESSSIGFNVSKPLNNLRLIHKSKEVKSIKNLFIKNREI